MKYNFQHIQRVERELHKNERSIRRLELRRRIDLDVRETLSRAWYGFWKPILFTWFKWGGVSFFVAFGIWLAGQVIKGMK